MANVDHRAAPAATHRLAIHDAFQSLTKREKLYAHYMSRAAWQGARIILRQVSQEAPDIYELILDLYKACEGRWESLGEQRNVPKSELDGFLEYCATLLSNVGNYYGTGDQKFIPACSAESFKKLASASPRASVLCEKVATSIFSVPPYGLGFPSKNAQSAYYPGDPVTQEEVDIVSRTMDVQSVLPENTRVRKVPNDSESIFEVLQGSTKEESLAAISIPELKAKVRIRRGDHSVELQKICDELELASKYSASDRQQQFLYKYIESFTTGDLEAYKESQRLWVSDVSPRVENIFGFVEPYRDPAGIRSEFEGLVAISSRQETELFTKLVNNSATFIRRLPWASEENNGKGPFEKALFEPPDFTSIHSLAYCSSILFPGINLPNYNDIRQDCGFKNVIVANRMSAESKKRNTSPFVDASEAEDFQKHKFAGYFVWVVLHELLGHGTSKLLSDDNFDKNKPPINPLNDKPIDSWYAPNQTWTGVFGDLATSLDECRAELVGAYLIDDKELLALFGYTDSSELKADDVIYNVYLQIGVDGLRGLANYNVENAKWGQAHSRAHFAMLKWLLRDSGGCIQVTSDHATQSSTVKVDRSRISSHGKLSLGRMLLRLHIYRCTANERECREFYEDLSKVDGDYLLWRDIVVSKKQPNLKFVQANTFLEGDDVRLQEYDPNNEGIIQSWAERDV
ncbi:MAG: hypothetical protein M1831_001140 [Alyxoria varia]|nr:MAG: hypothetical protein M1831_001140 [Alyxoria varia]